MNKYIEPRLRRDFGGIITAYFDFLKANFKGILNVFLGYNGIFLIFILLGLYMLVTGFIAVIMTEINSVTAAGGENLQALMMVGGSAILLVLVFLVATLFNYGLCSAYIRIYEKEKRNNIPKKEVWKVTKSKFGGMFLIAMLGVVAYFVFVAVQLLLGFIPVLGSLISAVIGLGFNAWLSLTVFSLVYNDEKTVFESIGEAWDLLFSSFWKAIGVNFVLGFIINIALFSLNIIPALLIGLYIYFSVQSGDSMDTNVFGQILIVVFLTLFCVILMFMQLLSQSINAFLYFNLHEFKHNVYLRSRIEKLGIDS